MVTRDSRGQMVPSKLLASAQQRAAFLETLGRTGVVSHAAAELGLAKTTLYRARAHHADFAAGWDAALAATTTRRRRAGEEWGATTRARFLDVLANAGSPAQAAAAVGRTLVGAYRARGRSDSFARDWAEAQERALDLLEAAVAERALGGVRRTVTRGTETIEQVEFSDRLAIFLLKALRPEKFDRARAPEAETQAPRLSRAELVERFRGLTRRIAREVADEKAAREVADEKAAREVADENAAREVADAATAGTQADA